MICWIDKKKLSILKDRKSCQTGDFRRKCVRAFVCWSEQTTTAASHFGQSTNGHLFWIKWYLPLPSASLCIYHVVCSKVIFNMRAPFPMCCSTTNHRESDECDNAQSCRVFSPHLSLVIPSEQHIQVRHSHCSALALVKTSVTEPQFNAALPGNLFTFPSTVSHGMFFIFCILCFFP